MADLPPARHLLRAKDLADARYAEPIRVTDMARVAGLSPAHFSRAFQKTYGESPVGPPGQDDIAIVLMAIPGPPMMDAATTQQVRDLMAKGFAGTVFLTTDDVQRSYEEMLARGVEFTETPEARPYGIDCGFRDPSGNSLRVTQLVDAPAHA